MNNSLDNEAGIVPEYTFNIWEAIVIFGSALGLIGLALIGLGFKAFINATNQQKIEAVARSILDYKIPVNYEGVFGVNIGSAKVAYLSSKSYPNDLGLIIAKIPTDRPKSSRQLIQLLSFFSRDSQLSTMTQEHTETRFFCNDMVAVKVENGQITSGDDSPPLAMIKYTANTTIYNSEILVEISSKGQNAKNKADAVFNSLKCK